MKMFYEGDLQSGISTAVQQSKLVACFVRDSEDESATWEEELLQDATVRASNIDRVMAHSLNSDFQLSPLLLEKTLLLRLWAGSQEAGFLAAIYPIPKTPTLVIIHSNGQLKEYLTTGISRTDFINRVKIALNSGPVSSVPATTGGNSAPSSEHESDSAVTLTSPRDQSPDEGEQSRRVRELLAERSARLESRKKEQDANEKAKSAAKAKARKEALERAATDPENSKKAADMKYALMQKKHQQDARNERARILQRVEDDKAERRAKEALRKEQASASSESTTDMGHSNPMQPTSSTLRRSVKDQQGDCALQVRLFDGSTMRSRFQPQNTLQDEVRKWIDSQNPNKDMPYTFKQVLTPHPNRAITVSEESKSLRSLGLSPSATLILVPVKDYVSAYEGGAASYITKGVSAGVGLVSSSINLVTNTLGSLFGGVTTPSVDVEADSRLSQIPTPANVRLFSEERKSPEEHQLYNGNTLNFEPRKDEDNKED